MGSHLPQRATLVTLIGPKTMTELSLQNVEMTPTTAARYFVTFCANYHVRAHSVSEVGPRSG